MQRIYRQLTRLPQFDREEIAHQARLINTILLFSMGITVVLGVFFIGRSPLYPVAAALALLMQIACLRLVRRGLIQETALGLVLMGGASILVFGFVAEAISRPHWFITVTLLAGLTLGGRAALLSALFGALGYTAQQIAHTGGLSDAPETVVALAIAAFYLYLADGNIRQAIRRTRDYARALEEEISERKATETELRENRARYQAIVNTQTAMVCRYQPDDLTLTFVNEAFARFYGRSVDELTGLSLLALILPDERTEIRQRVTDLLNQSEERVSEYPSVDYAGETCWHQWRDIPLFDSAGRVAEIQSVAHDITERVRTEQALRSSERRYRTILETAPLAIAVTSLEDMSYLYVNPAYVKMLGSASADDFLGRKPDEFISREWLPEYYDRRAIYLRTGAVQNIEVHFRRIDGSPLVASVGAVRTVFQDQPATLNVISDITLEKQIQAEREQADKLRLALEKERQISTLRDSFVAMMSHEFRTPLTVIRSSIGLLRDYFDRLPPDRRSTHLQKIDDQSTRMVSLLDDILMLSKANAGMLEIVPEPLDLPNVCHELIEEFKLGGTDGHDINLEVSGTWPVVTADERLLRHILHNLLSNAVKYGRPGTPINVRLTQDDDTAILYVEDQGIGIPENALQDLFKPFTRAANVGAINGTGLGLALAQESARLHGGTLTAKSTENVGTTMIVRLPLRASPQQTSAS
ncbi:MAG: PAS domain-containing sensor histidine kinase [Chloroflexota bacterium]